MAISFQVRFDGLDARRHQMDMRELGKALIGLDRSISDAVFLATEDRLPKPRERRMLVVRVEAPQAACVELHGVVEATAGVLPLAWEILKNPGTQFIFEMLSYLLKRRGGKPREAEAHAMEAYRLLAADRADERATIASLVDQTLRDRDREREFIGTMQDRFLQHAEILAENLAEPLKQVVSPIGRTSETLSIPSPMGLAPTVIDVPMAEAVRSKEPLEVGDMTRMRVRVDGLIKHNRQLKVELEGDPGRYLNAEVRDPAFDETPNVYTQAVSDESFIEVDAKPTYRNGELVKLHIMNAV